MNWEEEKFPFRVYFFGYSSSGVDSFEAIIAHMFHLYTTRTHKDPTPAAYGIRRLRGTLRFASRSPKEEGNDSEIWDMGWRTQPTSLISGIF
jgi:hypothetical protein